MPTLAPAKRAQLAAWLREFASDFAQQPKGVAHLAKYADNRNQGRENYARVKADVAAGKDITDRVLDGLLPHADAAPIRARGAWVHVAPVEWPAIEARLRMLAQR